jgi:hypothetical protein
LFAFCRYKALERGIGVVQVDPRNTSRTCPRSGGASLTTLWLCFISLFTRRSAKTRSILRRRANGPYAPGSPGVGTWRLLAPVALRGKHEERGGGRGYICAYGRYTYASWTTTTSIQNV